MKKVTIIGGDIRLKTVKNSLENAGFLVDTLGLFDGDMGDIITSDVLVLPVPTTKDGVNVFAPITNQKIPLEFIEKNSIDSQLILCCNYLFEKRRCIDYNVLDSYALLNAVPTAEGAIKLAIENTPFTLWGAKTLVIGYGRVGKILANRLNAMGCNVTVSARKPADFGLLSALGINHVHTNAVNEKLNNFDIVFNTVDVKVIEDEALKHSNCHLFIDLSSKGGFDLETAKNNNIKAINAPGLPGKIAPQTAGEILAKTVIDLINSFN